MRKVETFVPGKMFQLSRGIWKFSKCFSYSSEFFMISTRITYKHPRHDSLLWNWMKNLINSRKIDVMLFASYSPRCYFFIKSKRCDNSMMIAVHKPVRESTVTTTLKFDNGCCCCVAHLISHRIIYVDICGIFVVYYESAVARNCVILSPSWNRKHCHISYLWMTRLHLPS